MTKYYKQKTLKYIPHTPPQKKKSELINEFGKVAGIKINIEQSTVFLYCNNNKKKIIQFATTLKRIKHLGINLPKELKFLNSEK